MSHVTWTVVAALTLVALVVFVIAPGLAILAALAFGIAVVFGILLLVGRGSVGAGATPELVELRDEFGELRDDRAR